MSASRPTRPALRRLLVDPLESRRLLAVGVVGTAEQADELLDISLPKASPMVTFRSPLSCGGEENCQPLDTGGGQRHNVHHWRVAASRDATI